MTHSWLVGSRFRMAATLALASVFSLAGCGGTDSKSAKPKAESLADFFGGGGSQADQQARAMAQQRKQQEKTVACMRKLGFEYVAFVPSMQFSGFVGPKEGEEDAWKRRHGYGMADGMSMMFQPQPPQQRVDPNQAIREKLSSADKRAYEKALYGFDTSQPLANGGRMQLKGCMDAGYAEQSKVSQGLGPKFEAMYKRVQADPRISELDRKWSSCLRSKGVTASSERDIFEKVLSPEQQKLFNSAASPGEQPAVTVAVAGGGRAGQPSKEKVEEFRRFELKVANADVDCRSKNDAKIRKQVQAEYESAFIAANRTALAAVKAANG